MSTPPETTLSRRGAVGMIGALAALAGLGGCASVATRTAPPAPSATPPRPASAFQQRLDDLRVPLALPPDGKAIVVNIPAFELIAFAEAAPVLRSRVIVGAPKTPTPVLDTWVRSVAFRPKWRPTPDMIASGEYRDRVWPPGPRNPLGLAAVRLEPGLLVYLHDTNRRSLFAREDRALSHGCVRVERWDELIAWILDMDRDEVLRRAEGSRSFETPAPHIPVTLGYFTSFPDETGAAVAHPDIYALGA